MEGSDIQAGPGKTQPTPTFSAASLEAIATLRQRYPTNQAALIPALFVAQRQFGHLDPASLELVAQTLGLPASKVIATATFYTMFNKEPVGRFHVQVCKNISCYLRGSDDVTRAFEDELDVDCGATTADGQFTLTEVECLAACGRAPVVQVNEDYHEWVSPEGARNLVEELRKKAPRGA